MQDFFTKYQISNDEVIAVGVSGGADSLALALRLNEQGHKVVALTVDHGLRPEARTEAEYVASLMQKFAIEHHILTWIGTKPTNGVEEAARQARYNLLFDFCHQHNIKYLATGHHRRDQAETFLLRLARGSGVFGLSGILPKSERQGITIIRPQLDSSPDDLKKYLRDLNIKWIEDPMNDQEDFARVKMRKFLPQLETIGITEQRLAETATILQSTREYLHHQCNKFINDNVRRFGTNIVALPFNQFIKCESEIARLVLGELIRSIGDNSYQPEAESLQRIISEGKQFKGCTLGKCEIEIASHKLWIIPQDSSNTTMTTAQWDKFVAEHPEFTNSGLPYKVRRAIWQTWK